MYQKIFIDAICKCGCGEQLENVSKTTYYRIKRGIENAGYKIGHGNKGERNPKWRGGSHVSEDGYKLIKTDTHPNRQNSGGYILEHRLIMSQYLGRALLPNEIVHHKDHNKLNNQIDNLEITTRENHQKDHHIRVKRTNKVCAGCGQPYFMPNKARHNKSKFCSRKCRYMVGKSLCRKVSLEQEQEILKLRGTMSRKDIAEIYGISVHGLATIYYRNRINIT